MALAAGPGRGARRPAAAGRRRLPGHDPDRRRAADHLAGHLRRQRRGHRGHPRPADRLARAPCGAGWPRGTTTRCSTCSSGPPPPGGRMSAGAPRPEELVEVRIPVPRPPGRPGRVLVLATELGHQHLRPRDRPLGGGRPGRAGRRRRRRRRTRPSPRRWPRRGHRCSISPVGTGPMTAARPSESARGARRADPWSAPSAVPGRQVHLPPGPAAGRPGRGDLHHHRAVPRRRRGPDPARPSRRSGAGVRRPRATGHRHRRPVPAAAPRRHRSTSATRAPGCACWPAWWPRCRAPPR